MIKPIGTQWVVTRENHSPIQMNFVGFPEEAFVIKYIRHLKDLV